MKIRWPAGCYYGVWNVSFYLLTSFCNYGIWNCLILSQHLFHRYIGHETCLCHCVLFDLAERNSGTSEHLPISPTFHLPRVQGQILTCRALRPCIHSLRLSLDNIQIGERVVHGLAPVRMDGALEQFGSRPRIRRIECAPRKRMLLC